MADSMYLCEAYNCVVTERPCPHCGKDHEGSTEVDA